MFQRFDLQAKQVRVPPSRRKGKPVKGYVRNDPRAQYINTYASPVMKQIIRDVERGAQGKGPEARDSAKMMYEAFISTMERRLNPMTPQNPAVGSRPVSAAETKLGEQYARFRQEYSNTSITNAKKRSQLYKKLSRISLRLKQLSDRPLIK